MAGEKKVRTKSANPPKDLKVDPEKMKKVVGGFNPQPEPPGKRPPPVR